MLTIFLLFFLLLQHLFISAAPSPSPPSAPSDSGSSASSDLLTDTVTGTHLNPNICFYPSSGINLLPVEQADCWKSAAKINCDEKLLEVPMDFSRDPNAGFQVPYTGWSFGTCNVVVDLITDNPHEVANIPLVVVGTALLNLIYECVHGHNMGGKTTVTREQGGSSDILSLVVRGQVSDPMELGAEKPNPNYGPLAAAIVRQCSLFDYK